MIKLETYNEQQFNKEKNIGFMRFDFTNGNLANSFVAGPDFSKCSDKVLLQAELNEILFEQLGEWEQVGDLVDEMKCLQEFCVNDVAFYYAETEKFQYVIKLVPAYISKIQVFEK